MNELKKINFRGQQKVKVALEAVWGLKTINQIAQATHCARATSAPTATPQADTSGFHTRAVKKSRIDEGLQTLTLQREIANIVSGFLAAITLARDSDLIATVPERHTLSLRTGMHSFPLPFAMPEFTVSMLWHPRMDADPAHRWLRECVFGVCTGVFTNS